MDKIKVKLDEKKLQKFNQLMEIIVNSSLDFSRYDDAVTLYLENESGWNLRLTPDGRWNIE